MQVDEETRFWETFVHVLIDFTYIKKILKHICVQKIIRKNYFEAITEEINSNIYNFIRFICSAFKTRHKENALNGREMKARGGRL